MQVNLAIVYWRDPPSEYFGKNEDVGLMNVISVGHVVSEDDEVILLCQDYGVRFVTDPPANPYRTGTIIPKVNIVSIKYINEDIGGW